MNTLNSFFLFNLITKTLKTAYFSELKARELLGILSTEFVSTYFIK